MKRLVLLLCGAVVLAGCGGDSADRDAKPDRPQVSVSGVPAELEKVVATLYSGGDLATSEAVSETLAGRTTTKDQVAAAGTTGEWRKAPIAVVTYEDDVTLAVEGEDGWRVAGGWWPSLGIDTPQPAGVRHVLVLGSDARPHEEVDRARADSIHIVSVSANDQGAVVGIPRDSWVPLSTGGSNKINAALTFGGPQAMADTVENFSGLPIEGYLLTGFDGFSAMIDQIGGLTVDVKHPYAEHGIALGRQLLKGEKLLWHARNRKFVPDGDFGRSRNQGTILLAAAAFAKQAGPDKLVDFMQLADKYVATNLTPEQMFTLAARLYRTDVTKVPNEVLPAGTGTGPGGASIVVVGQPAQNMFADLADGLLGN